MGGGGWEEVGTHLTTRSSSSSLMISIFFCHGIDLKRIERKGRFNEQTTRHFIKLDWVLLLKNSVRTSTRMEMFKRSVRCKY